MRATDQDLLTLTAGDLMTTEVTMIPQDMSLQAAAHLLSLARVTGAPVVDGEGHCVGVLSATDFLHWAEAGAKGAGRCCVAACFCSDWQIVEREFIPHDAVRNHMTPDPVVVKPSTSITELARNMLSAHIHRVIVVDETRRPVGVVSSTDVLAAVAYAEDGLEEGDAAVQWQP
jgi:CBS domain-containing protein